MFIHLSYMVSYLIHLVKIIFIDAVVATAPAVATTAGFAVVATFATTAKSFFFSPAKSFSPGKRARTFGLYNALVTPNALQQAGLSPQITISIPNCVYDVQSSERVFSCLTFIEEQTSGGERVRENGFGVFPAG